MPNALAPRRFTLVKLLVVIAVIAILVSILLPSLGKAREVGRGAVCMGNMRSIGLAMHYYGGDYDQVLPRALVYTSDAAMLIEACYNWVYAYGQHDKVAYAPAALSYSPATQFSHLGKGNSLFLNGHVLRAYLLPAPYDQSSFYNNFYSWGNVPNLLTVAPNYGGMYRAW